MCVGNYQKCDIMQSVDVCAYSYVLVFSLYDAYSDEMGILDFSRSQNGSGMASQSQV